jgi:hypothetical protein
MIIFDVIYELEIMLQNKLTATKEKIIECD